MARSETWSSWWSGPICTSRRPWRLTSFNFSSWISCKEAKVRDFIMANWSHFMSTRDSALITWRKTKRPGLDSHRSSEFNFKHTARERESLISRLVIPPLSRKLPSSVSSQTLPGLLSSQQRIPAGCTSYFKALILFFLMLMFWAKPVHFWLINH